MSLGNDLEKLVKYAFRTRWDVRNGIVVPDTDDLSFKNEAVRLDATVLYADISESTNLVDDNNVTFAAEIYKTFLYCASRIIRSEGGEITAYDGDRVMAVYLGEGKNTKAVRTGLKINYAAKKIITPAQIAQYPKEKYRLKHVVGIDTSQLHVVRAGVRGDNDLVWIGRAANYAAKLCSLSHNYATRITGAVYDSMNDNTKFSSSGDNMWEKVNWTDMNNMTIYRSTWRWSID
jgi:class 3 adenylate cyclase